MNNLWLFIWTFVYRVFVTCWIMKKKKLKIQIYLEIKSQIHDLNSLKKDNEEYIHKGLEFEYMVFELTDTLFASCSNKKEIHLEELVVTD